MDGFVSQQGFGGGGLMERGHLEDLDIDVRIILKGIFKKRVGEAWSGFIWLRIGKVGEVLRVR